MQHRKESSWQAGRKKQREGGREKGREGGKEEGRKEGREGGREGGRDRGSLNYDNNVGNVMKRNVKKLF